MVLAETVGERGGLAGGATRGRLGGQRRRTDGTRRRGAGRREVGDEGRGSLVNKPKFKTPFCNFNFSPSSWPQMKKC